MLFQNYPDSCVQGLKLTDKQRDTHAHTHTKKTKNGYEVLKKFPFVRLQCSILSYSKIKKRFSQGVKMTGVKKLTARNVVQFSYWNKPVLKQSYSNVIDKVKVICTVEPRSTDTRLRRTPVYNGQFRLSRRKAQIFSFKLTRLIRTPVNTDNGQFPVES